jgi:hypothetical protein
VWVTLFDKEAEEIMGAPKSVDSTNYHVWTDAIHARALARQTNNEWDRGTYVRWAIISSCTAFEMACNDALGVSDIGYSFQRNVDAAVNANGLDPLEWGQGLWQQVLEIIQLRKDYVHRMIPQEQLFPPIAEADSAIRVLREAIKDIYSRRGLPRPSWVDYDSDPGWPETRMGTPNVTLVDAGTDENDPEVVRVAYVYRGEDRVVEVLPAGSDPHPVLERLIENVIVPISAVRAYKGTTLIEEIPVRMRGS